MALVPFPNPQSGVHALAADDEDDDPSAPGAKMSFLEHLDELRKRIVRSCIAIAVCVVAGFYWVNQIVDFILAPTRKAPPAGVQLLNTQPGGPVSLHLPIPLVLGVVVAPPVI